MSAIIGYLFPPAGLSRNDRAMRLKLDFFLDVINHSEQYDQGKDHFSMETGQVQ